MEAIDPDWVDSAYCANEGIDPDRFTMQRYESHQSPRIKQLVAESCARCIVKRECLIDAVDNKDVDSVRAGITPGQRKNILPFRK